MERIDARKAMILWETTHMPDMPHAGEIRVVHESEAQHYAYLGGSLSSCCIEWDQAGNLWPEIMSAFLSVLSDGVSPTDAHREFLKMDIYAGRFAQRGYFGIPPEEEDN